MELLGNKIRITLTVTGEDDAQGDAHEALRQGIRDFLDSWLDSVERQFDVEITLQVEP